MATKIEPKDLKAAVDGGKTTEEVGKEYGLTRQKVQAIIKKYEIENKAEDEFPPEMFAKSGAVIHDKNMGGAVVMTGEEYREFSLANDRYDGRRAGEKTQLNTGELRIAMNIVKRGDCSGIEMRDHLLNKHGISTAELINVAKRLTLEEEQTKVEDVTRLFRIKV